MDKDVRISQEELKKATQAEYAKLLQEVERSVNRAPGGAVIAGSEEAVRDAMARFRERVYQIAIQLRADKAAKAAFSPSTQPDQRTAPARQRGARDQPPER
jgi:RNase P/RNase MRP subunit p30